VIQRRFALLGSAELRVWSVTRRRVKAFVMATRIDLAGDVLPGRLPSQVSHLRYTLVIQDAEERLGYGVVRNRSVRTGRSAGHEHVSNSRANSADM